MSDAANPFQIPESARVREIAWPPGGPVATYYPHERQYVTRLRVGVEEKRIPTAVAKNEIDVLHAFKVEFDAVMLTEEEERELDDRLPLRTREPARNQAAAHAARDRAIRQVDTAADPGWKDRAYVAVEKIARRQENLIADDVWVLLGEAPLEPRAMGPIMLACQKRGYIEGTTETREGNRVVNHARPQRVWRSLLYGQAA